ncbi:hypothetical protein E4634_14015 [Mangrovimicrobium sediminis]|uniref:Uncharacterized protein n=1 Tax=Mangrovimicrobium sediminis TaxID=2562682 RepID=A0A4Z0LZH6_9GAMM|nr:hypothetical protein [Haliea sp. SAOS-164]TGD72634.1 hypothetical protein E4634_14015 [Haliea sp. SAOS-164]
MSFRELLTGADAYTIFNVQISRARTTKHGKKDSPLPPGHFRVQKGSKFLLFWNRTGLPTPRRLSSFHDYMTKLKPLVFVSRLSVANRLDKDTLSPLSLSHWEILHSNNHDEVSDNISTTGGHFSDKLQTSTPDKRRRNLLINHAVDELSGAGAHPCGAKVDSLEGMRDSPGEWLGQSQNYRSNTPENQTTDEWLAEYDGRPH